MLDLSKAFTARSEMGRQAEESFKPRFIRQLRNVNITEGDDAFLDCIIIAVPEPKVPFFCSQILANKSIVPKINEFIGIETN